MGNRSKRGSDFVSFICQLNKHNNVLFVLFTFIDRFMTQDHTLQLQGRAKQHLTFTSLINHLEHLVTGPSSIADMTKKELQSRFVERESLIKSVESRKSSDTLDLNIWEDISAFLLIWYRPRRYFCGERNWNCYLFNVTNDLCEWFCITTRLSFSYM